MPVRGKIFSSGGLLKQPVMRQHDSFSVSTCLARVDQLQTGVACSPAEEHSDKAKTLRE